MYATRAPFLFASSEPAAGLPRENPANGRGWLIGADLHPAPIGLRGGAANPAPYARTASDLWMGKGEELGRELRHWITVDRWQPASGPALANRLIDLLGEQDTLKAPLRDLSAQPQFLSLLRQPQAASAAAVEALCGELSRTYAPGVLNELQDLIHAAIGLRPVSQGPGQPMAPPPFASQRSGDAIAASSRDARFPTDPSLSPQGKAPQPAFAPGFGSAVAGSIAADPPHQSPLQPGLEAATASAATKATAASLASAATASPPEGASRLPMPTWPPGRGHWSALADELVALGPGLALGFSVSLVLAWAAGQLDRALLDRWGWSGGVTLALVVLAIQIGSSGPLRRLRRHALLSLPSSAEPGLAWRWLTAPWFHARGGEALTHVVLLLILLGSSPLPLNQVVLRYSLTALASEALAVLSARLSGMTLRRWGGAAGPVASLIGLASCLSLLNWRELGFQLGLPGQLSVPAWVLLVIYASLQLAWQLPRTSSDDTSRPGDRLWSSTWWWGTWLGVGWGLLTWSTQTISQVMRHGIGR